MNLTRIKDGQDLELLVTVPLIDGTPFQLDSADWDLHIYGIFSRVDIESRGNVITSVGPTSANVEIKDNQILVYIKSSKVPLGPGGLSITMTIYAPHEKFEDELQVMKTIDSPIDVILV